MSIGTVGTVHTVWCDSNASPQCARWVGQEIDGPAARAVARKAGWKRRWPREGDAYAPRYHGARVKLDVCPACQAVPAPAAPA